MTVRDRSIIDTEIAAARAAFLAADEAGDYESGDAYFSLLQLLALEVKAIPQQRQS